VLTVKGVGCGVYKASLESSIPIPTKVGIHKQQRTDWIPISIGIEYNRGANAIEEAPR
jgi:hypothetical protein